VFRRESPKKPGGVIPTTVTVVIEIEASQLPMDPIHTFLHKHSSYATGGALGLIIPMVKRSPGNLIPNIVK